MAARTASSSDCPAYKRIWAGRRAARSMPNSARRTRTAMTSATPSKTGGAGVPVGISGALSSWWVWCASSASQVDGENGQYSEKKRGGDKFADFEEAELGERIVDDRHTDADEGGLSEEGEDGENDGGEGAVGGQTPR